MRLTIVGSGDAFGSGGRFNTCFLLETAKGDAAGRLRRIVAGGAQGARHRSRPRSTASFCRTCTATISAGLPFLLLDAQFLARRERPLMIAGPPGTRARLDAGARGVLSARRRQPVAVSLGGRGDRARPPDRRARALGDRPRRSCTTPARPRPRCGSPTARSCSPIPATPNGSRRLSSVADGADLFIVRMLRLFRPAAPAT